MLSVLQAPRRQRVRWHSRLFFAIWSSFLSEEHGSIWQNRSDSNCKPCGNSPRPRQRRSPNCMVQRAELQLHTKRCKGSLLHTKALINHTSFWPGASRLSCDSISFAIASLVYAPFVEKISLLPSWWRRT